MSYQLSAEFIPGAAGRLFVLCFDPPAGQPRRGTVLHVPAFAEEMNRARRQVALQARAMASQGWRVVLADLHGSGDSEGEFSDATWQLWQDDILTLAAHYSHPQPPILWGLRLGALLARVVFERLPAVALLLWQPVLNGRQFLRQFLRLRLSAGLLTGQRQTLTALQTELAQQGVLEVAGYSLSQSLAADIETAVMGSILQPVPTLWCEVVADAHQGVAPASQIVLDTWPRAGLHIATPVGVPFWQTQEIHHNPDLITLSCDFLHHQGCLG